MHYSELACPWFCSPSALRPLLSLFFSTVCWTGELPLWPDTIALMSVEFKAGAEPCSFWVVSETMENEEQGVASAATKSEHV